MLRLASYSFHPKLILRTPTRAFTSCIGEANLAELVNDTAFQEALYLASPVLWAECGKWQRGELTDPHRLDKLRGALTRYYVRATSRCTPFGLFAGCALTAWGPSSRLVLDAARTTRHTRLDMHYLCALAQHIAALEAVRPHLRYWPSSSLYPAGGEFRYVEYHYVNGLRINQLSAVEASPAVTQVLQAARPGATYAELVALLSADGTADLAEAAAFVDELLQAQLLVHELEPTVTGPEFFGHLLAVCCRVQTVAANPEIGAVVERLHLVEQALHALDQAPVNEAARYEHIAKLLVPLGVPLEAGKLFQTDTIQGLVPEAATVSVGLQADLLAGLRALTVLTPAASSTRLTDFQRRFEARYEEQEVPLLDALDNESGLSYTEYGQHAYAPLVHDLVLPEAAVTRSTLPSLSSAQELLARRLRHAQQAGHYEVVLTEAEVQSLEPSVLPLPPSLAVMFRLIDSERVLLENASGSSAVNLLGRFAHASPSIEQLVREITDYEQTQNPAVAFAEICHLPASRVGNVLLRPSFRAIELPYLAQASLPATAQVPMQDLLLAVRGGQFVLHARSTRQRIIPRLSTAHNFTQEALPVYQFLCDLQTQGLQPYLGINWPGQPAFEPRLCYGRVVLAPAAWHLEATDLRPLLTASAADLSEVLVAFREQWQLPRWFVLADGDNELLIDADNEWLVRTWLDAVRGQAWVHLKEFLTDPAASSIHDVAGQPHTQQLMALLLREGPVYPRLDAPVQMLDEVVTREFTLGSEWLYYKLYCGQQKANSLLLGLVQPLTQALVDQGLLDYWFFIRYADPDSHLRLRLHLPDPVRIGEVIRCVDNLLRPWQTNGTVWKVQVDTYRRELERYGSHNFALTEQLFGWQSEAVLAQLSSLTNLDNDWLWGLEAIDQLLEAFDYPLPQKSALLLDLRDGFFREFNGDKKLRIQLDAKYRQVRPALAAALPPGQVVPPTLAALADRITALAAPGALVPPALLASYIHMLLNRLLPSEARLQELVLYDFLYRHYQGVLAQKRHM